MISHFVRVAQSFALILVVGLGSQACRADSIADFDDLLLAPNSSWSGPDPNGTLVPGPDGTVNVGSFTSGGATFVNRYNLTFGTSTGFAYSNTADTTTPGFMNQFSAITGTGRGPGADNYGVATGYADVAPTLFDPVPFDPTDPAQLKALPTFTLPAGSQIAGMYVTNTTYAALSMLQGDGFAKKFGGTSGNDPDWFKLTAYGIDAAGRPLASFVELYLADYRFADNALDYILTDWTSMDLSALSGASQLHFNVSSSDTGQFGMNTPGAFAVDDIRLSDTGVVPEPSSVVLMGLGAAATGLAALRRRRVV